jgi:hypothetical protein
MQHLFNGDVQNRPAPPLHTAQLFLGNPLVNTPLHTVGAVEVAAHDAMFKLGGFGQHVDQLAPVLDPD